MNTIETEVYRDLNYTGTIYGKSVVVGFRGLEALECATTDEMRNKEQKERMPMVQVEKVEIAFD